MKDIWVVAYNHEYCEYLPWPKGAAMPRGLVPYADAGSFLDAIARTNELRQRKRGK